MGALYFVYLASETDFERLLNEVRKRQKVQFLYVEAKVPFLPTKLEAFLKKVSVNEKFQIEKSPNHIDYLILTRTAVDLVV